MTSWLTRDGDVPGNVLSLLKINWNDGILQLARQKILTHHFSDRGDGGYIYIYIPLLTCRRLWCLLHCNGSGGTILESRSYTIYLMYPNPIRRCHEGKKTEDVLRELSDIVDCVLARDDVTPTRSQHPPLTSSWRSHYFIASVLSFDAIASPCLI